MTRWHQRCIKGTETTVFPIAQNMLDLSAGSHPGTHHPGRGIGQDGTLMMTRVIAMGVGDKSKGARSTRIEPQIARGEKDSPIVDNFDHDSRLDGQGARIARKFPGPEQKKQPDGNHI